MFRKYTQYAPVVSAFLIVVTADFRHFVVGETRKRPGYFKNYGGKVRRRDLPDRSEKFSAPGPHGPFATRILDELALRDPTNEEFAHAEIAINAAMRECWSEARIATTDFTHAELLAHDHRFDEGRKIDKFILAIAAQNPEFLDERSRATNSEMGMPMCATVAEILRGKVGDLVTIEKHQIAQLHALDRLLVFMRNEERRCLMRGDDGRAEEIHAALIANENDILAECSDYRVTTTIELAGKIYESVYVHPKVNQSVA